MVAMAIKSKQNETKRTLTTLKGQHKFDDSSKMLSMCESPTTKQNIETLESKSIEISQTPYPIII